MAQMSASDPLRTPRCNAKLQFMSGSKGWARWVVATLVAAAAGCATTTSQLQPLAYNFEDQPDDSRVMVRYRNAGQSGICVLPEHWPNPGGAIDHDGDRVFLHVGGRRFALRDFNTGYCPEGCATYVGPGREISGFMAYRDFQLPSDLEDYPKRLEFKALGFSCRRP